VVILDLLREQVEVRHRLELENARQQQELDDTNAYVDHIEPDAEAYQGLVREHAGDYTPRQAANLLCGADPRIRIGRKTLIDKLREWKVINDFNEVHSAHKHRFYSKMTFFTDRKTGEEREGGLQVRVRKLGLSWLRKRLIEEIERAAAEKNRGLDLFGSPTVTDLTTRRGRKAKPPTPELPAPPQE
jgi:hypothetical protein